MNLGHTRITTQGQTSVPAQVRRRFGLGPGAEVSWEEIDGTLVLKVVSCTLADFALRLPAPPPRPVSLEEMEAAIGEAMEHKAHARH